MRCECCGEKIDSLLLDVFSYDGSDSFYKHPIQECEEDAVIIDTTSNWTGYELSEEEQMNTIECPYCKEFPFKSKEIQTYEIVRIVCFKTKAHKENN